MGHARRTRAATRALQHSVRLCQTALPLDLARGSATERSAPVVACWATFGRAERWRQEQIMLSLIARHMGRACERPGGKLGKITAPVEYN